jgi:hypothetical protein
MVGLQIMRQGSAGAESPEAAVQAVVDAVEVGDTLAVVASVVPGEVRGIGGLLELLAARIDGFGMATTVADRAGGLPVTAATRIEVGDGRELSDGVSSVSTTLVAEVGIAESDSRLGSILGGTSVDVAEFDSEIIAVLVDGTWYVSPKRTTAQAVR